MAGGLLFAPKASHPNIKPRPFRANALGGPPYYSVFECEDGKTINIRLIMSTFALDVRKSLRTRSPGGTDLGKKFLYAINSKTKKRLASDYKMMNNDIIKIVST